MWVHQRSAVEIKQTETDKQQSNITIQILAEQSPHMDEALFLQKIILQNGIGRGTNNVVSVMKMKRYNICFLTADSREWYGIRSMRPRTYQNLTICLVCLGVGSMEFLKNISH